MGDFYEFLLRIFNSLVEQNLTLSGYQQFWQFMIVGFVIFLPLEIFFRAKKQGVFRFEWGTDLLFFAGQFFIFNALSLTCLIGISLFIQTMNFQNFHEFIANQPWWVQTLEIVFLCDICIYWGHRLSHKYEFLWRFHKIHHTSESLDWLAAYREHPLDNIYTRVIENLPALLLGFPLETIVGFMVFRGYWGLFIHSNVNITMGPLAWFIGSPRLHHWHHEKASCGKCNFANLSPLMDIAFGTYYDPGKEPENFGLENHKDRSYLAQIFKPLVPNFILKKKIIKPLSPNFILKKKHKEPL